MISTKKTLTKHFFTYSILPILIIEVTLIIIYFTISFYIANKNIEKDKYNILVYGKEILKKESEKIDQSLKEVEVLSKLMQNDHQNIFNNPNRFNIDYEVEFDVAKNGVFYKKSDFGSSLYYSAKTPITKKEKEKAILTEAMDPLLKSLVVSNDNIVASYFNSFDNMNRLFPYINSVYDQYGEHIQMSDYNFYFLADAKNNPTKKPVWTQTYLDPAGNGWMLSCIVPIYTGEFLQGVSGIDITIDRFITNLLEKELPYDSNMFIVDENGVILAMPSTVEKMFDLKELRGHDYNKPILNTVKKPEMFNVFKNDGDFSKKVSSFLNSTKNSNEVVINNKDYLLIKESISTINSSIIFIIENEKIYASAKELRDISFRIGELVIVFAILFYIVFFYFLIKNSKKISDSITKPLKQLARQTSKVAKSKRIDTLKTDILEINKLNKNFERMANELKHRTKELKKSEFHRTKQEKEAIYFHDMSLKDPLTGLFNRAKIQEDLNLFFEEYKEFGTVFSIIIMDIDYFKSINDNYGHSVGDNVLKKISEILTSSTRTYDSVGRYGGEEFIIITQNNLETTKKIAESLRTKIEETSFDMDIKITSSFGISQIDSHLDINSLIELADKNLYYAKNSGRNLVSCELKDVNI